MSAFRALDAARAAGVEVRLDGKDLVLSAASEPPTDVLDMLRRHKRSIVGLLQQRYIAGLPQPARPWDPEDWQALYDERAASPSSTAGCRGRKPRHAPSSTASPNGSTAIP